MTVQPSGHGLDFALQLSGSSAQHGGLGRSVQRLTLHICTSERSQGRKQRKWVARPLKSGLQRNLPDKCEMGLGRAQGRETPQNACHFPEETMGEEARHADKC